jgi:hypothetical protein
MITLPCGHTIPATELLRLAGSYRASLRTKRTPGTGRPRTLERCACGQFTLKRMPISHSCVLSVLQLTSAF